MNKERNAMKIFTQKDAVQVLVEQDVKRWGESKRASATRSYNKLSLGLLLLELASRAQSDGKTRKAAELRAAADRALTNRDLQDLQGAQARVRGAPGGRRGVTKTFIFVACSSTLFAAALVACEPEISAPPAIYVPESLEDTAVAWRDAAELDADIVVGNEGPEGPGIWVGVHPEWSGWESYKYESCRVREAWVYQGSEASNVFFALTGAAGSAAPIRVGTVMPPEGVAPTLRIDPDQQIEIKEGWQALQIACVSGGWSPW